MAHLVKMLTKKTSLPIKFGGTCHASGLLMTCDTEINLNERKTQETQEEPVRKIRKKKLSALRLKRADLQKVESVVGVSVTPFAIGWAKIDLKEMRLKACNSEYLNTQNTVITESMACKKVKEVQPLIPKSDVYIMESCVNYMKLGNHVRGQLILSSMLGIQLHESTGPLGDDNIFFQDKSVIDSLYDLVVRNERVSAGQVLQRKLGDTLKQLEGLPDKTISVEGITLTTTGNVMQPLFSSKPFIRDSSAVAFFIALSFVQLNFKS